MSSTSQPSASNGTYNIQRRVLPNGVVVVARHVPDPDIVAISVGIRSGARFETDATAGATKFIEKLLTQGTRRRPTPDEVQRPLTVCGGSLWVQTGSEMVIVQSQVRGTDIDLMFDVVADVVLESQFAEDRVANEARVILEELSGRKASPGTLAGDIAWPAIFGDHPLRRSSAGDEANTTQLTRDTLVGYRDAMFVGPNTVVAVAGNLEIDAAFERVAAAFGGMPSGAAAPPSNVPPPPPNPTRIDHQAGSSQARVILGGPLPGLVSEDRFPLSVANAVLGGSGFRLFREIRDKRGLSYDPGPGMAQFPDAGLWMVSAGTAPENVALMIELFTAELERIRTEPVSADELTNARNYLEGSLVVGLETPIAQAGQMIRDEKFGSPVLSDEHKAGIRRVTADDVLRVCRDYLDPARATTVVVAP